MELRARENSSQTVSEELVERIYDVALLIALPAKPDHFGTIDPNCEDGPSAGSAVAKLLDELINTIKETIEPNSWSDAGGSGVIEVPEYRELIILQTLEIHQKIKILLDEMKKAKSRVIQIEARFIMVTEDFLYEIGADVNSMQKYAQKQQKMSMQMGMVEFQRKQIKLGIADSNVSTRSRGYKIILNDFSSQLLLKVFPSHNNISLVAPKVTVLNGEHATLFTGEHIPYISGFAEPNESSQQPQPLYEYMDVGTRMEVLPKIKSQGDILLELNLSLSSVAGYEKRLNEDGNEYDVPNVEVLNLSTQALIPDGGTLLIGGGKNNIEIKSGQIVERDLLILIKPEIIEPDSGNDNTHSELPARFSGTDN
jgi:type II secretory pathway component GspD/PulD (secretin)